MWWWWCLCAFIVSPPFVRYLFFDYFRCLSKIKLEDYHRLPSTILCCALCFLAFETLCNFGSERTSNSFIPSTGRIFILTSTIWIYLIVFLSIIFFAGMYCNHSIEFVVILIRFLLQASSCSIRIGNLPTTDNEVGGNSSYLFRAKMVECICLRVFSSMLPECLDVATCLVCHAVTVHVLLNPIASSHWLFVLMSSQCLVECVISMHSIKLWWDCVCLCERLQ